MAHEPTDEIDLRTLDVGDEFSIEIDTGEQFDLYAAGIDHFPSGPYARGHVNITAEGADVWEQVKDRVESEVLHLRQHFERRTGDPRTPRLFGTVWKSEDGAPKEAAEPHYEPLGEIATFDPEGGDA